MIWLGLFWLPCCPSGTDFPVKYLWQPIALLPCLSLLDCELCLVCLLSPASSSQLSCGNLSQVFKEETNMGQFALHLPFFHGIVFRNIPRDDSASLANLWRTAGWCGLLAWGLGYSALWPWAGSWCLESWCDFLQLRGTWVSQIGWFCYLQTLS